MRITSSKHSIYSCNRLWSFTLHTQGAVPDWEREGRIAGSMKKADLIACTAPLTTLQLSNFINIDESLITLLESRRTFLI